MKEQIISKISELWGLLPDLRFGQMIDNFVMDEEGDFYYEEDCDMLIRIEEKITEIREKQEDRKIAKLLEDEVTRAQVLKVLRDERLL